VQAAAPATVAGDDARALLAQQERTTKALERCAAALRVIAVAKADTQDVVKFGASMQVLMAAWRDAADDAADVAHAQEVLAK
jgi:transcription elongation GreA/GreB family factor